jgi:CBS domain containing-hemolysin-like protein
MGGLLQKSTRWAIRIGLITAIFAIILSVTSTTLLSGLSWPGGLMVLLSIVGIGVGFDMLGIAATAAREQPLHAMAAKKVPGSKEAIGIIRRADQFSNFCNDVIGDISGVISGAASFAVVTSLVATFPEWSSDRELVDVLLVSLISALTVGGKAIGKTISIHYANQIVLQAGKFFYFINEKFGLHLFEVKPKKKRNRKRGVLRAPRTD